MKLDLSRFIQNYILIEEQAKEILKILYLNGIITEDILYDTHFTGISLFNDIWNVNFEGLTFNHIDWIYNKPIEYHFPLILLFDQKELHNFIINKAI